MFAQRLAQLRQEKGIYQKDIAKHLGITTSAYGFYEQNKRQPDQSTLQSLADFFNVSVDYLLGRANERRPGADIKAIDDPEVIDFMKTVVGEFRLDTHLTPNDRQEIMEDLSEYFRFKLQQKKNQRQNY